MKLRWKVFALVLPLVIIPAGIIGGYALQQQREISTVSALRDMQSTLDEASIRVQALVETATANVHVFADSPFLQRYVTTQDEFVRYSMLQPSLLALFSSYQEANPDYLEIRILRPDGFEDTRSVIGDMPNLTEQEGESELFRQLMGSESDVSHRFAENPDTGRPALIVSKRLVFKNLYESEISNGPTFRGFLVITVDLSVMAQLARGKRLGETGRIYFLRRPDQVWFREPEHRDAPPPDPELLARLEQAAADGQPVTIDRPDGPKVFASRVLYSDLLLVGCQDEAEVLAASRKLAWLTALALAFAVLLSTGALLIGLNAILVRRIGYLNEAAAKMGDGDLTVPLDPDGNDELGELTESLRDMTKKLDESGREAAERTRTLAKVNVELQQSIEDAEQARQAAEAASHAKSEFLARMSHEIRTPMNGVLGMTELLMGTQLDQRQEKFAGTIHHSAEALLEIINDVLDFSRGEAGKLGIEETDFDMRELIEETVALLAPKAQEKGLEIAAVLPPDFEPLLRGDPTRIRQVLTNLLGNALKFTESGGITVRLSRQSSARGRLAIKVQVTDTGVGIPSEHCHLIFDSFTQGDSSTTRRFGGTGLGLAICKQLIELMGGEIGVESTPGEGACFWFSLDLERSEQRPVQVHARLPDLEDVQILLVDDSAANLEILENHCRSWKMITTRAESIAMAKERLAQRPCPFDAAIIDLDLPDGSGLDLASYVRGCRELRALKLVLVSSVSHRVDPVDRRRLDIAATLWKPLRQSPLYDALAGMFSDLETCTTMPAQPESGNQFESAAGLEVLLVEDNAVNLQVGVGILESLGCVIQTALNGLEALEAMERRRFDVVLMDCQMPDMDGLEATRRQRQRERKLDMAPATIIALTANAISGDRQRCLDAGMDDYLSKPFTRDELARMLIQHTTGETVAWREA